MCKALKISLLDYSPVDEGQTATEALASTVRLAQQAEAQGFSRYWVSEHHGMPATVSNSPEILMTRIAAATKTIRVGSGGVLLPNYSSLKLAENYLLLEALFPGRVDLGFGRAPGADQRTSAALNDEKRRSLPYTQKVADLLGFITGQHEHGSQYEGMKAHPESAHKPQPFVLGASGSTSQTAAKAGIGFTFAHFINPSDDGPLAAQAYREAFQPTGFAPEPHVVTAVFVAIGDTQEEAERYAAAFHLWLMYAESGSPFERVPSLTTTADHQWSVSELAVRQRNEGRLIYGTAPEVVVRLRDLAGAYGTDEVMINLMMPQATAREKALSAISEALKTA
ncbi:LLM class flavin-dependent oxidoreductase [Pokkaliibacter sp. CJK22405]|uniref:LLM class flavin-dependent oxidoreductase n=1 Tax=Pokkaliibacter sp. CJK22405 TaxID=3384615 RepID=UPI003984A714